MNKEINLPSGNYIFVELPADALNDRWFVVYNEIEKIFKIEFQTNTVSKYTSLNTDKNCYIISTTNDSAEEQCESIVGKIFCRCIYGTFMTSSHPCKKECSQPKTAKSSLNSLMQSVGLDLKNNYLIIKKI